MLAETARLTQFDQEPLLSSRARVWSCAVAHLQHLGQGPKRQKKRRGALLRWWVCDELNALLDVALEARNTGLDQLLLVVIGTGEDVHGLLCTRWL